MTANAPSRSAVLAAAGLESTLPAVEYRPSRLQLFRFSAVTWNAHRIHYDEAYAREEGHAGIVVQSTLRGAQLLGVLERWLGPRGVVTAFSWRNLRPSHSDERVVCSGSVTQVEIDEDGPLLTVELEETNDGGQRSAAGYATVRLHP